MRPLLLFFSAPAEDNLEDVNVPQRKASSDIGCLLARERGRKNDLHICMWVRVRMHTLQKVNSSSQILCLSTLVTNLKFGQVMKQLKLQILQLCGSRVFLTVTLCPL